MMDHNGIPHRVHLPVWHVVLAKPSLDGHASLVPRAPLIGYSPNVGAHSRLTSWEGVKLLFDCSWVDEGYHFIDQSDVREGKEWMKDLLGDASSF